MVLNSYKSPNKNDKKKKKEIERERESRTFYWINEKISP
jgi:hypothetical protein